MIVKYFVPEDGDDINHPNVFNIQGVDTNISLGEIKQSFPLLGKYHFRFFATIGNINVWMDILDDSAIVPCGGDGNIIAKVSRIEQTSEIILENRPPFESNGNVTKASISRLKSDVHSSRDALKEQPTEKLISFGDDEGQQTNQKFPEDDLLGINTDPIDSITTSSVSKQSSNVDLFGLEAISTTNTVAQPPPMLNNNNTPFFQSTPPPPSPPTMNVGNHPLRVAMNPSSSLLNNNRTSIPNISNNMMPNNNIGGFDAFNIMTPGTATTRGGGGVPPSISLSGGAAAGLYTMTGGSPTLGQMKQLPGKPLPQAPFLNNQRKSGF